MQCDFYDAHDRHWQDAEQLFQAQRWANADHLYGVAAECGLKALMLKFGMVFNSNKDMPNDKKDREHANGIWARYESYRSGHQQGVSYGLPSANPFQDWHVSQRYAHQADFDIIRAESHRKGAELVCKLIKQAKTDGLI
ncbi:MAG: hypothetical protein CDV28_12622 [Candidatus Electronema aureum]|uniref:SAM-dependent methyltransferase n=1 Tax=Candidatus Electronema aureum TaxID=2005002 RepID=A0A521G0C2_9BACT|nr:MAG: hypothetical protein CDV28_12622 [Candidatus Electronema aureum]